MDLALGIDEGAARTRPVFVLRGVRQKLKVRSSPVGATRLFPVRVGRAVLGTLVWGNSGRKTPSRSTGYCAGAAEPGHPVHSPLPDQGSTRLPHSFNQVVAATLLLLLSLPAG